MKRVATFAFAAGLALAAASSANAALLVNGDFDTGDFTGWSTTSWFIDNANPDSASFDATNFCGGLPSCLTAGGGNGLSQTVADGVGQAYGLSFAFAPGSGARGNSTELVVLWDGAQIFDQAFLLPDLGYSDFVVSGLVGTGSDTVEFLVRNDTGQSYLDNVNLAVPEPGSLALLGAGLAGFGWMRRRRKQPS